MAENGSKIAERAKNGLKKGKSMTGQGLALGVKQAIRNRSQRAGHAIIGQG